MPISDGYLDQAAQDIGDRADTVRINDADDFAVDSAIRTDNSIVVKAKITGYVNPAITNIKLLEGANIISDKTVSTSIDTSVDIGEFEFDFLVERGV